MPSFSETLLTKVRGLPGVADAEGGIDDQAQLVGHDGKVIATRRRPGLAFSVNPAGDQRFNPLVLTSGRWPSAPQRDRDRQGDGVERSTSRSATRSACVARGPVADVPHRRPRQVRRAELARRRDALDLRPADRAAHLPQGGEARLDRRRRRSRTSRRSSSSREIKPILPTTAQVRTGQAAGGEAVVKDTNGFLDILQLLPARVRRRRALRRRVRDREHARRSRSRSARASSRRCGRSARRGGRLLASVMLEAFVIGVARVAHRTVPRARPREGAERALRLVRDRPPAGGDRVRDADGRRRRSLVGVARDADRGDRGRRLRATRVQPIAAVREGAVLPPSRFARFGPLIAIGVIVGAVALMLVGLFVGGLSTKARLLVARRRRAAVFIGVAMLAPTLVPPLARVLGWPAARLGGAAGKARARQLDPESVADGVDGLGADDRPHARDARGRARRRTEVDVRERGERRSSAPTTR